MIRRMATALAVAMMSVLALSSSALAQYSTSGGVSSLPSTGSGTGVSRLATELPVVLIAVVALAITAAVVGRVARRAA